MPLPRRRSALGFSQPLGGFGRDDDREPELPRTHASAAATPRNDAALFHAAGVLGIRPSELSPLGEPHRLPAAVASLRVRRRSRSGAKTPAISDRFRQRTPPKPPRAIPCGSRGDRWRGDASSPRPSCQATVSNARVAPHALSGDQPEPSGTTGSRPIRPLRSLAPPESPFTDRPRLTPRLARQSLRPHALRPTGPLLSWDFAPSEPSPPRPRVRSTASPARGEPDDPRKTTPHSGEEHGASILRSRISGTSGGAGWPPNTPRRQTLRASAALSEPPLPLVFLTVAAPA
jgi:hypothetical protein